MTPSPSPTPTSSPSSRPTSSPTSTTFHDSTFLRPSFLPPTLPPISQISFQPDLVPMGVQSPSYSPSIPDISTKRSRHGKQRSDDSPGPCSSDTLPQTTEEENPGSAGPSGSDPEPRKHHGKKKRTRTLTTPHQSAVLHALLAQSRFPTTAMREEVGRSIGLSARKVQVWFQNQRQKARKPRGQSSAPSIHPPQFESFPTGASSSTAGPSQVLGSFQGVNPVGTPSPHASESPATSVHPRGLPAPNIGVSIHSQHTLPQFMEYNPSRPSGQQQYSHGSIPYVSEPLSPPIRSRFTSPLGFLSSQSSQYPSHTPFQPDAYSHHSRQGGSITSRSDPPIVLPPLRFDLPRGAQMQSPLPPLPLRRLDLPTYSETSRPTFTSLSPSDIASSSSSHLPSSFTASQPSSSRHAENIPPPFTLQPEPQWDHPNLPLGSISTLHAPGSSQSYGSQGGYRRHRRNSDPTRRLPQLSVDIDEERPLITQPWPLPSLRPESNMRSDGSGPSARRFDPVHSAASEGERGTGPRRNNRHTYDFGRPSGSFSMRSPPRGPEDVDREVHHESD